MNLNVLGHQTTGKVRCRRCDSEHECQWLRDTTCDKPSIKCVSGRESLCRMCRPLARLCVNCRPLHAWCRGCSRVLQKTAWIVKATGSDVAYNVCGQCVDRRLRTSARKKLEKTKQDESRKSSKKRKRIEVVDDENASPPKLSARDGRLVDNPDLDVCMRGDRFIFESLDAFMVFLQAYGKRYHGQNRRYGSLVKRGENGQPSVFVGRQVNPMTTFFTQDFVCVNRGTVLLKAGNASDGRPSTKFVRIGCTFSVQAKVLVDNITKQAGRVLMTCKHPHNVLCVFHRGSERAEPASMLGKTPTVPTSCPKSPIRSTMSSFRVKRESSSSITVTAQQAQQQQNHMQRPLQNHAGDVAIAASASSAAVTAEASSASATATAADESIGGAAQLRRDAAVDRLGEFASGGEKTLGDSAGELSNFEEIVSKMTSRTAFHQAMEMLEHYRKAKDGQ